MFRFEGIVNGVTTKYTLKIALTSLIEHLVHDTIFNPLNKLHIPYAHKLDDNKNSRIHVYS